MNEDIVLKLKTPQITVVNYSVLGVANKVKISDLLIRLLAF